MQLKNKVIEPFLKVQLYIIASQVSVREAELCVMRQGIYIESRFYTIVGGGGDLNIQKGEIDNQRY